MGKHLDNSVDLRGRKKVCLRARTNLQISTRIEAGRRIYLVKDPIGLRYYHFDEGQHFAFERMNGRRTLAHIQQAFERQFKPQRLKLEELETFAGQLLQSGLAQVQDAPTGQRLYHHARQQQTWQLWSQRLNIFYIKIPLLNPDRLLQALMPLGRTVFHPLFVGAMFVLVLTTVALIVPRWDEVWDRLPNYQDFFCWRGMLTLWVALGIVKVLHELGHGLCAKSVGGDIHEMGVVLLFFFPTLYCNVTDAWTLPDKWKRIAISAAGIYVELVIASLAAGMWWCTASGTILHDLSFALLLVCSVHTLLFNANPLMRFDGYFMLSDAVEIPNLAQVAGARVKSMLKRWFGMTAPPDGSPGSEGILVTYGVASFAYRLLVIGGVLYVFYTFMKEQRLPWLGMWGIALLLASLLAMPIFRLARTLYRLGRLPAMNRVRVWITLVFVMGAFLLSTLVPLPMTVRGVALVQVEPSQQQRLVIPSPGGFLTELFVRDGQRVKEGDVLARITNRDLDRRLRLVEVEQSLRLEQQQSLATKLASLELIGSHSESYEEIEHELRSLSQQRGMWQAQRDSLTLRAPADGVVIGLSTWEIHGKWLNEGTPLCVIGNETTLRAVVLLSPADRHLIDTEKRAWFLSHGTAGKIWHGSVSGIAQVDAHAIPPQLSNRIGGEIVSRHDPTTKTERPNEQLYLVTVQLPSVDHRLQVGALGQMRIDAGSRTLWWRVRRFLGSTFDWGL